MAGCLRRTWASPAPHCYLPPSFGFPSFALQKSAIVTSRSHSAFWDEPREVATLPGVAYRSAEDSPAVLQMERGDREVSFLTDFDFFKTFLKGTPESADPQMEWSLTPVVQL